MYKDKDKQREANRERQRRYKERHKGVTSEGVTDKALPIGFPDELKAYQPHRKMHIEDEPKPERTAKGNIRVSKPGDADYVPQCETTKAFIENRPKRPSTAKRGKDIKCFEDLPPDVQQTIRRISESNEEFKKRVAIAIKYQHTFPERYHSQGLSRTSSTTGASL